jgi:hypothetical protein
MVRKGLRNGHRSGSGAISNGFRGRVSQVRILPGPLREFDSLALLNRGARPEVRSTEDAQPSPALGSCQAAAERSGPQGRKGRNGLPQGPPGGGDHERGSGFGCDVGADHEELSADTSAWYAGTRARVEARAALEQAEELRKVLEELGESLSG